MRFTSATSIPMPTITNHLRCMEVARRRLHAFRFAIGFRRSAPRADRCGLVVFRRLHVRIILFRLWPWPKHPRRRAARVKGGAVRTRLPRGRFLDPGHFAARAAFEFWSWRPSKGFLGWSTVSARAPVASVLSRDIGP